MQCRLSGQLAWACVHGHALLHLLVPLVGGLTGVGAQPFELDISGQLRSALAAGVVGKTSKPLAFADTALRRGRHRAISSLHVAVVAEG